MLSSDSVAAAPREVVEAFVHLDVERGRTGGFASTSAPTLWWSPGARWRCHHHPFARLLIRTATPLFPLDGALESRYREALGDLLTMATVPNGHNLLWESPAETGEAIERFLAAS